MKECKLINLPNFGDQRGKMTVLETDKALPFSPKRAFFIYDVPKNQVRGEHANMKTKLIMVAINGSVDVVVSNGSEQETFVLNDPTKGLFLDSNTWKTMKNFSKNAILLIIADTKYDKAEYITDYAKFKERQVK